MYWWFISTIFHYTFCLPTKLLERRPDDTLRAKFVSWRETPKFVYLRNLGGCTSGVFLFLVFGGWWCDPSQKAHSHQPQRSEAIFTFCTQSLFAPIIKHTVQCSGGLFTHTHTYMWLFARSVSAVVRKPAHTHQKHTNQKSTHIPTNTHDNSRENLVFLWDFQTICILSYWWLGPVWFVILVEYRCSVLIMMVRQKTNTNRNVDI